MFATGQAMFKFSLTHLNQIPNASSEALSTGDTIRLEDVRTPPKQYQRTTARRTTLYSLKACIIITKLISVCAPPAQTSKPQKRRKKKKKLKEEQPPLPTMCPFCPKSARFAYAVREPFPKNDEKSPTSESIGSSKPCHRGGKPCIYRHTRFIPLC
jgi:hypothetical protein